MLREMAGDMLHISRYAHMKFLQDPHVQARDSSCAAARRASETLAAAIIELSAKTPHGLVHIWPISGPYLAHIKRQARFWCHTVAMLCHAVPWLCGAVDAKTRRNRNGSPTRPHCCSIHASMHACRRRDANKRFACLLALTVRRLCHTCKLRAPSTRMRWCIYATCRQPVLRTTT